MVRYCCRLPRRYSKCHGVDSTIHKYPYIASKKYTTNKGNAPQSAKNISHMPGPDGRMYIYIIFGKLLNFSLRTRVSCRWHDPIV